jgi:acetoin:2,6-dichlorophenolindophenol oxidoreductase subunit beta
VPAPGEPIPLGRANIRRAGTDVTVIGYGTAIQKIEAAASALEADGVSVEILDPRTLVPLDEGAILESVAKTRRAVVVHDSLKPFGVGAEISCRIHEELFGDLKAPVQRVGTKTVPVPFNPGLAAAYQSSAAEIEAAVRATLN